MNLAFKHFNTILLTFSSIWHTNITQMKRLTTEVQLKCMYYGHWMIRLSPILPEINKVYF